MAWKHRASTRRHPLTWLEAEIVILIAQIHGIMEKLNDVETD